MLVGIVLRGSAFVLRQYGGGGVDASRRFGRIFAVASTATPVFLGVTLGGMRRGGAWLGAYPLCVGLLALALFAMLAAVYLAVEAQPRELCDDFRKRAIGAALMAAALAALTGFISDRGPPPGAGLASLALGGGLLSALVLRRLRTARALAIALVAVVIAGWGARQYPYFLTPDVTVASSAAPEATLRLLVPTLLVGAVVLFPSLYWLLRVFKRSSASG
jgi:cytochrome d ubiquinol oxidase subunit II